jgi:hypothetical protein
MKSIKIACVVVELTLLNDSEVTGQVYAGTRNNSEITVICPPDQSPWAVVSSTDAGEASYIMWMHEGSALRISEKGVYSFKIEL